MILGKKNEDFEKKIIFLKLKKQPLSPTYIDHCCLVYLYSPNKIKALNPPCDNLEVVFELQKVDF